MPFVLAVDYDSTLMEGSWPENGAPKQDIIDKVKEFKKHGAECVLWTCREGNSLKEAEKRCQEVGLDFDAINENAPSQVEYINSTDGDKFGLRKIVADFYVDDKSGNLDIFLGIDVKKTCDSFENR